MEDQHTLDGLKKCPWPTYISGHTELYRYLKTHQFYNDQTNEKMHKDKKLGELFLIFGSGPDADSKDRSYWCPDVREAIPVIEKVYHEMVASPRNTHFSCVYCSVGEKGEWKNVENAFRTDKVLPLTAIPTIYHWGTGDKLVDEQCKSIPTVRRFFEKHLQQPK